MEIEDDRLQGETVQYCTARTMASPEIVEIGEESRSVDVGINDVYVAVGKDDMDVVKWALDHHVVSSAPHRARVFLVHIFPPITYIPTPVGRLSRSQLSQDQVRVYINEESNRRRNILQKYIRLCADAKVTVDTMLIEHENIANAILDLIPVINITKLVIGTKRSPYSRRLTKKLAKGEFLKKHAPDYCEVTVVYNGQKVSDNERAREPNPLGKEAARHSERKFFECGCFSACRRKVEELQACVRPRKDRHKNAAKQK
ncbi:U-box domain-containing protein 52-like isoform X2 [Rhodamnia argentea]|uniref:U-box domain-containing protein 52-like isoform X2 n=1 Tax=Rhodamnia argentea TaxID=178133 RepID=A0A8B8Q5B2_9MYRT|nr:U-box domain-containing protein 52-like isoform X2 [Rhodamnia argentea]